MSDKIIRIATRKSPLALWQAEHVARMISHAFPEIKVELVKMTTRGDRILDAPLAKIGGKGLFVKELEQGMLQGRADIAVHSMKDVPVEFPEGLHLASILQRDDPFDAMVSNNYCKLSDLPDSARIGTSSLRRQCQILDKFPNAEILPLRGNVNTRLEKLDAGDFDAIILAAAGLRRLGMAERIAEKLSPLDCLPAIGQGAIGIECRVDDEEINQILQALNDTETNICVLAERAMNATLQGGCQVPIAGYCEMQEGQLVMRGLVGKPDGSLMLHAKKRDTIERAEMLGIAIAKDLLTQGADKILTALFN